MTQAVSRHRSSYPEDDVERSVHTPSSPPQPPDPFPHPNTEKRKALRTSWSTFHRKGEKKIGIRKSLKAIVFCSWLNVFLVLLPLGWISHFKVAMAERHDEKIHFWSSSTTFIFCFLGIMPLQKLFEYGGDQMACYLGVDLGDLLVISLNNVVEATLAVVLLINKELKLLQSTIIGVVLLHLLLIPGVSFLVGGARLAHQELHPRFTQLNQTLLSIGVLSVVIPAAIFAALDRPVIAAVQIPTTEFVVSDETRHTFLVISRVLAFVLLTLYICSRVFLHNPPGDDEETKKARSALQHAEKPDVNQYVCIVMLVISIGLTAATLEWLVESVDFVRDRPGIELEWFGLILLPFLSFAADGVITVWAFLRYLIRYFLDGPEPPAIQAQARAIDLSIQFLLFWMPFLVLLGWCMGRPLTLLFDFFEIAVLVCACFVVNYVVADAKTNWAEGLAMVAFYVMIAAGAWHYPGEKSIIFMSAEGSVEEALLASASAVAAASAAAASASSTSA